MLDTLFPILAVPGGALLAISQIDSAIRRRNCPKGLQKIAAENKNDEISTNLIDFQQNYTKKISSYFVYSRFLPL